MIDARRGEVYTARYRLNRDRVVVTGPGGERLISPARLLEQLDGPILFLGDGVRLHQSLIIEQLGERLGGGAFFPPLDRPELMEPDAAAVVRLALQRWKEGAAVDPAGLAAVYLRPAVEQTAEARADWESKSGSGIRKTGQGKR